MTLRRPCSLSLTTCRICSFCFLLLHVLIRGEAALEEIVAKVGGSRRSSRRNVLRAAVWV
jgi:hypothetical protein